VLHGPAAIGKSSLLHAGALPLLGREAGVELLPVSGVGRPAARPLAAAPPFNGYSFALLSHWAQFEQPPELGTSIADFLLARPSRVRADGEERSLLAAIDQFEALFTGFPARESERADFIDELAVALRQLPALKLLLVVSDDHVATLSSYEQRLSPYPFSYVRLDALKPGAALEAAARPLDGTGWSFAAGVAEDLIERLRTVVYTDLAGESATVVADRVEPLFLQIVCAELWSSLPGEAGVITADDLRALGDVDQALARFYDAAVRAVQLETGESEAKIREWVESVFITEQGTRGTACRGILTTAGMPNRVADELALRRVLTAEYRARGTWYQLGQDRMISPIQAANRARWPALGLDAIHPVAPATPEALSVAAEAALAERNFPSAHRFAEAAAFSYRESGNTRRLGYALVLQADVARAEGDLHAAEEHLHVALSLFAVLEDRNLTARTLSALADVRFLAGDYQEAAQYQRDAVDNLATDVDALVGLGYAQWYGGSPADAEATFSQAITWDAKAARAFGGRGQVLAEMNEYATALTNLDPALDFGLPPTEEMDAHSARALALTGLGRDQEADRELATARSQDPARARTLRRAGRIAAMRDQPALAVGEVEKALRADPPLPPWDETDARRLLAALREKGG
jgi:tetratricopeptide (TPR) repeat protein